VIDPTNAMLNSLSSAYTTPFHPTAYSGRVNLKRQYPFLTNELIEAKLAHVDSYALHRPAKRPKVFNPFYIYKRRQQVQFDLLDIHSLALNNDNVTFLLIGVDSFSRYLWCLGLTNKRGETVARALTLIFDSMALKPTVILTDEGTEFLNTHVRRVLHEKNIELTHPFSNKAAFVERANASVQRLIYESITDRQNPRYIDILPQLIQAYNTRVNRIIKMSPVEADLPSNRDRVLKALSLYMHEAERKASKAPKFHVGQIVRIQLKKNVFSRGYNQIFKREAHKIHEVITKFPRTMYKLSDYYGKEILKGNFYESELQAFSSQLFKLVLPPLKYQMRRGKRWALVNYMGYKEPEWIRESDLVKLAKQ
jgi:hypothetical protein